MAATPQGVTEDQEVSVSVPADSRFVALTRVAAASLAAELDFSVDQIDDLRIAVDELVSILVEAAGPGARLDLRYGLLDDGVQVSGSIVGETASTPELDELTRQILAATVDDHSIGPEGGFVYKRRLDQ